MKPTEPGPHSAPWWRSGVIYQIYLRSFADSNGDGIGDIPGITGKLDYLEWLGVDGIWMTPCMPSPDDDWGYDVSDYCDIHEDFGTLEDAKELITEADRRNIKVLFDLVPNHTSDRHEWFVDSRSSRSSRHRNWYVWRDAKNGGPPNNWLSVFGGSAWEWDEPTGQYYLHNFLPSQPDLDWWNEDVRGAFDDVLRFWFDFGVAGFRIDVAHGIIKDRSLRDNLPVTPDDPPSVRRMGQRQTYSANRPEVHEVLQRWRALCNEFQPEPVLIGETWVWELERMAEFYGTGANELHLAFNFPFIYSPLDPDHMKSIVTAAESLIPGQAWPAWTGSNHDVGRLATRWCGGDVDKVRCALMLLLTLRGTPFLYQGDEIAMTDVDLRFEDTKDPVGRTFWPELRGRDSCRTPMRWNAGPGAGFTTPDGHPWLPIGDPLGGGRTDQTDTNVEAQTGDPNSVLTLCRDLIRLRRCEPALSRGTYELLDRGGGVWAFLRGDELLVAINFGAEPVVVSDLSGTIVLGTSRHRDGDDLSGGIDLAPHEGVIVKRS
ncbi:MAG: alpha-amylase family glycosyl hydrolase [Actinomycetota bacterium]|nr:alpha-amylase family glycosyl hydrolase [Actinomycetota bacterium]